MTNAADLQGLQKRLNERMSGGGLIDKTRKLVVDIVTEAVIDWLKTDAVSNFIAARINEAAVAMGFNLELADITNKDQTRQDVDAAITQKINALAGTAFTSLMQINKQSISVEVGRMLGEQLGTGPLFPIDNFRAAMGAQFLAAFDAASAPGGPAYGAVGALFGPGVVAKVENVVVANWREVSARASTTGNPMHKAGPPRDAAHAAVRAANRKRQAKYRAKHYLKWVPLGEGGESTGNGREGLTGRESGNEKPVRRWLQGPEH